MPDKRMGCSYESFLQKSRESTLIWRETEAVVSQRAEQVGDATEQSGLGFLFG